jgi:hypothetical protein
MEARSTIQEAWSNQVRLAAVLGRLNAILDLRGRVVCGWCRRLIRLTREVDGVTTGICPECSAREFGKLATLAK